MTDNNEQQEYRVLARKYRPQNFAELIGQDALVRTLTNAIETGRIAHAFMLTGVRGVGKTTTARIIAKALNYKGADGTATATTGDTSDCQLCQAISEDRHPDVIEMDAASRTGIDDIREILDGVRYAPTEARYKVYIIDEVHMLSKQAFNALLKTLEEPPEHVKFIFATTEIRKVPITVLSRCQRFDLRRVDVPTLAQHFENICKSETVTAEEEALNLIARAADGSVRDGLSIMDQAISVSQGNITADHVKNMLGLADKEGSLDLLEHALHGKTEDALAVLENYYKAGADPIVILQDVLDLTHVLTRLRAIPTAKGTSNGTLSPDMLQRAAQMSEQLSMPSLSKAWQLLLKGLNEVQNAPNPQTAAEMVVIRLCYAANLPDPKDLLEGLKKNSNANVSNPAPVKAAAVPHTPKPALQPVATQPAPTAPAAAQTLSQTAPQTSAPQAALRSVPKPDAISMPATIETLHDVIQMLNCANEVVLASALSCYAEPVKIQDGLLEIGLRDGAGSRIKELAKTLKAINGNHWMVSFVPSTGIQTPAEELKAAEQAKWDAVLQHENVQKVLHAFPGSKLINIHKNNPAPSDTE